jgi:predicted amidophosphoribosyltransferase
MIEIYCRGHHGQDGGLCHDCQQLWDYAWTRVERCPFEEEKPTCVNCTAHCFKREMRDRVRAVMRYAGPRMPARHPVLSVFHILDGKRPMPQRVRRESARS